MQAEKWFSENEGNFEEKKSEMECKPDNRQLNVKNSYKQENKEVQRNKESNVC